MNKKGFVLMETIIVIVVISVALLTIFASYNRILTKVKKENKYDTSEYIYITKYIKDYLKKKYSIISVTNVKFMTSSISLNRISYIESNVKDLYNIEKIYILTNINEFDGKEKFFDAYMIDYIRKLDVRDNDKLIIVEYKKAAKDSHGNDIYPLDKNGGKMSNKLYETYIASLEW